MSGPYREAGAAEVVEAPTRDGVARLEVAPQHTVLRVERKLQLSVTASWLTVAAIDKRRGKPRSLQVGDARVVMARAVPTEDVGIWYEERPGVIGRVIGLRPLELLDDAALIAWRALDRLAARLAAALAPLARGASRAWEFGRGQHRVLAVDHGDRIVIYARPLFRERQRRCFEVRRDGTVIAPGRPSELRLTCTSRFQVTVLGDRINFVADDDKSTAVLWLPWISPEDREELCRRLGALVDH